MAAHDKFGLVSRLLDSDSSLGIIAGLTKLAAVSRSEEDDGEEYDDGEGDGQDPSRHHGLLGVDKRTGRQLKVPSRGGAPVGTLNGLASPTDGAASPTARLSATAKKYSVHEQRDVIRKLQQRNQILKQELSIEFRDARQLLAHEKRQRVEYLQKMTETFTKKVETAKKSVAKLEEQIAKKEHELETLRQQQYQGDSSSASSAGQSSAEPMGGGGGQAAMGETGASITRRVRALENRLELSLVKRNEMDSINKHFRWQIEKVRKDRVIFDGIYKKLEKELSDFQSRYDASVAELKKATEAKELVSREILQIQEHAETEQRQYDLEFKELRHAIENAMRDVHEANGRLGGLGAVGVFGEREEPATSSKSHSRGTTAGVGIRGGGGGPTSPQATSTTVTKAESPLKRIAVLSSWKIGFDKAVATTNDSIVSKYDQIFDGIKKMTGIDDITKIAEAITRKDEENFKRFRHVEGLHREEAALKTQVEEITQAIEEFKAQEGIATGATQKQQYRTLETKYQSMLEKNKAFDVEYEETTNKLTRLKSSVHSIHSMLAHANCARNADQFSLHGNTNLALGSHSARDVTDSNVLEYLQAIEIFTSSLMKENHESSAAAIAGVDGYSTSNDSNSLAAAASPIAHGPSTLSSDPAQKLRVQVPTFGGLNGMIILPAAKSPVVETHGRHSLTSASQQQQRKKTRFELSSRKSMSQQLSPRGASTPTSGSTKPLSAASESSIESVDDTSGLDTPSTAASASIATTAGGEPVEEDEDERAYTYEELRSFAAKHIIKKHDDPMARLVGHAAAGGSGSSAPSSPSKMR